MIRTLIILCLANFTFNTAQAQHELKLLVLDNVYARPMADVDVNINGIDLITNDEGRCIVAINKDTAFISFRSSVSDLKFSVYIASDTSIILNIPEVIAFGTVLIRKEKSTGIIRSNSFVLDEAALKNAILPGGTFDPIHLLLKLPGVSNSQEMNAGLNIRGGGAYATSIYWNDIPIPNLSHSAGFISLFDVNAIRKIEYFTSNVSSFYGNRGTSYIKFIGKETSLNKTNTAISLSPFLVGINSNIPLIKNKLGVNLSIRKSILASTYNYTFIPLFTDFTDIAFQSRWILNKTNSISATFLENRDSRKPGEFYNNQEFNDSNLYKFRSISLRHEGLIGRKLSIANIFYYTDFQNQFFKTNFGFLSISHRSKEVNFKSLLSKETTQSKYKLGIEVSHNQSENTVVVGSDSIPIKPGFLSGAIFSDYTYQMKGFKFTANQRLFNELYQGKLHSIYEYRTGIDYYFNEKFRSFLGSNKFANNKQTISDGLVGKPSDYSFFCDYNNILPQVTFENLIGLNLNNKKTNIILTYFNRSIQNVYDFITLYSNNYYYQSNLSKGSATSSGLEMASHFNIGKMSILDFNYTYSRTYYLNPNVNNGKAYVANFDRPHNGSINFISRYKNLQFNCNFILESGRPITTPLFNAFFNQWGIAIYSERNALRLPLYHRLDIGVQFNKKKSNNIERSFGIHLYNAYAHKNIYGVIFIRDLNTNRYTYKYLSAFPLMPSANYRISF